MTKKLGKSAMTEFTLMIRSQPLIYVPGFFAWVETAHKTGTKIDDFLDALGVPTRLWEKVKSGDYEKYTEGEDLVLVFRES